MLPPGWDITLKDGGTFILEVAAKTAVRSFSDFKQRVKRCKARYKGTVLSYRSIYGDTLTLDTSYKKIPTVNGKTINYNKPIMAFDSPFLKSKYDSGVVTIQKGQRKRILTQ